MYLSFLIVFKKSFYYFCHAKMPFYCHLTLTKLDSLGSTSNWLLLYSKLFFLPRWFFFFFLCLLCRPFLLILLKVIGSNCFLIHVNIFHIVWTCISSLLLSKNQECIFNQGGSCTFSNYGHFLSRYWATYNARLFLQKKKSIQSYFIIIISLSEKKKKKSTL